MDTRRLPAEIAAVTALASRHAIPVLRSAFQKSQNWHRMVDENSGSSHILKVNGLVQWKCNPNDWWRSSHVACRFMCVITGHRRFYCLAPSHQTKKIHDETSAG